MYLLGYSLNNLSLMALTISTGFVVDDAIVMIENIARYIEAGRAALRGGAQGRRADRLHHRVADRLAGRGAHPAALHGRPHRPPLPRVRGHARRRHRRLGRALADADADDVRPPPRARAARRTSAARSTAGSERAFEGCSRFYDRGLELGAAPPAHDARRHHRDARAHGRASRSSCPRASSRSKTPALLLGVTEAAPDVSFPKMMDRQRALADVILADPDVAERRVVHRLRRDQPDARTAAASRSRSSRASERSPSADAIIARLQPKLAKVDGIDALPAVGAGPADRQPRRAARSTSTRWRTPTPTSWPTWAPQLRGRAAQGAPSSRDVASDQESGGPADVAHDRPRHGVAPGHLAAGHRRHALRRLRAAAGLDHLHAAEPLPRHPRGEARVWRATPRRSIRSTCARRRAHRCRSAPFVHRATTHGAAGDRTTRGSSRPSPLVQPGARERRSATR